MIRFFVTIVLFALFPAFPAVALDVEVKWVRSLADDKDILTGTSLRAQIALSDPGKLTIIAFQVGGRIELDTDLLIDGGTFVLAGQMAPYPGVYLTDATVVVQDASVEIQHLNFLPLSQFYRRQPPELEDHDALRIVATVPTADMTVAVRHSWLGFAVDENVSLWPHTAGAGGMVSTIIEDSVISHGLENAFHPKGAHSKGLLVGRHSGAVTVARNLLAYNSNRCPLVQGDTRTLVVNNVAHVCPHRSGHLNIGVQPSHTSWVNNVRILGPEANRVGSTNKPSLVVEKVSGSPIDTEIHVSGWYGWHGEDDSADIDWASFGQYEVAQPSADVPTVASVIPTLDVVDAILPTVGPRYRHAVLKALIAEVQTAWDSGFSTARGLIDHEKDVGLDLDALPEAKSSDTWQPTVPADLCDPKGCDGIYWQDWLNGFLQVDVSQDPSP